MISPRWRQKLHAVGPGILFAGAAIGVSHLVQSTRAGAGYGFDLLWAVVLVLLFKYPFFQYAHRYTAATGESLLQGYRRLGTWALALFMGVVVISSFIAMAAVTVVTAGLAGTLLGLDMSLTMLSLVLLVVILVMLAAGHYRLLDGVMKVMVLALGALTLTAVGVAAFHGPAGDPDFVHPSVWSAGGLTFLLALMGWMPAPLDIGAWSSLWILAKHKNDPEPPTLAQALLDFNIGYAATVVLAFSFVSFGALVMFGTGAEFSPSGLAFSRQLVDMYTGTLGGWSRWIISLVAFITMFSTTITVMDGYARTLAAGFGLLFRPESKPDPRTTLVFMVLLLILAVAIIGFFMGGMWALVDIATVLAFLTAPLVAVLNFSVVQGGNVPPGKRPGRGLSVLSWTGIVFLVGFGLLWIWVRFLS
ncbi:MAG: Nramp family divalent metal transporter [Candidatus Krumholzibacteriota bacterium]